MRDWFARTFPSLAALDGPKLAILPLVLMMIFSIAVGVTSPFTGRAEHGDASDFLR